MKLFVYGTLKKGFGNHRLLEGAKFLGEDTIPGGMISLGGFPGWLGEGEGYTKGEVYEIDEEHLHATDRLEGYDIRSPDNSFYIRRSITATVQGEVLVYQYNGRYGDKDGQRLSEW